MQFSISPRLPHGLTMSDGGTIYGRPTGRWSLARRPKWYAAQGVRSRWRSVRPATQFTVSITDSAGAVMTSKLRVTQS